MVLLTLTELCKALRLKRNSQGLAVLAELVEHKRVEKHNYTLAATNHIKQKSYCLYALPNCTKYDMFLAKAQTPVKEVCLPHNETAQTMSSPLRKQETTYLPPTSVEDNISKLIAILSSSASVLEKGYVVLEKGFTVLNDIASSLLKKKNKKKHTSVPIEAAIPAFVPAPATSVGGEGERFKDLINQNKNLIKRNSELISVTEKQEIELADKTAIIASVQSVIDFQAAIRKQIESETAPEYVPEEMKQIARELFEKEKAIIAIDKDVADNQPPAPPAPPIDDNGDDDDDEEYDDYSNLSPKDKVVAVRELSVLKGNTDTLHEQLVLLRKDNATYNVPEPAKPKIISNFKGESVLTYYDGPPVTSRLAFEDVFEEPAIYDEEPSFWVSVDFALGVTGRETTLNNQEKAHKALNKLYKKGGPGDLFYRVNLLQ